MSQLLQSLVKSPRIAKNEEPRNREQKLLQEMWNVADEDAKKHIALVLVKMVQT
ncbi:MAG: DUF3243 family protein [Caryophanon sp.]|nr:DUF3243 family protein [Caryophanon sp.]